jgi:hypothetical protein
MAQAVSRRPLMAESQVRSQVSPHGICGVKSGTGLGFSSSTSVFACSIIPPTLNKFVYRNTNFMRRTRGRSRETFQRRSIVSEVSETCNRKVSSLFVAFKVVKVTREIKRPVLVPVISYINAVRRPFKIRYNIILPCVLVWKVTVMYFLCLKPWSLLCLRRGLLQFK